MSLNNLVGKADARNHGDNSSPRSTNSTASTRPTSAQFGETQAQRLDGCCYDYEALLNLQDVVDYVKLPNLRRLVDLAIVELESEIIVRTNDLHSRRTIESGHDLP